MNTQKLIETARMLVSGDKGLLAMDESTTTCNQRFANRGIAQTVESRRDYRELLVTTPGLGEYISGAILYDETIRQRKKDGTLFVKVLLDAGIVPGIKVDTGAKDLAGSPGKKSPKASTVFGPALPNMFRWARDSRSGEPCLRSVPVRLPVPA